MKGKLIIEYVDGSSSKTCSGRFTFEVTDDSEDPNLEGLEVNIIVPNKPKWVGSGEALSKRGSKELSEE